MAKDKNQLDVFISWLKNIKNISSIINSHAVNIKTLNKKTNDQLNRIERLDAQVEEIQAPVALEETFSFELSPLIKEPFKDESLVFDEIFRGSNQTIKKRQKKYVDYINRHKNQGDYYLDVGCGRGEFLELLTEQGIKSKGIDLNKYSVEQLSNKFDVANIDVNSYLKSIPNSSLIGISAFQVVEHLTPGYLSEFISLANDKIAIGGLIILETINTKSWAALANYYIDISHVYPYPQEYLRFTLEKNNFENLNIVYASPCPEEIRFKRSIDFNYMEYALLGSKKAKGGERN